MRLDTLLRAVPEAHVVGDTQLEIADIAYDSRAVRPGSCFVAVPSVGAGPKSGGHEFIDAAVRQGAVAVVATEGEVDIPGVTTIRTLDARSALADLADAFFDHPSRELKVFAVTGTDGKTTTTYLLDAIFSCRRQTGRVTANNQDKGRPPTSPECRPNDDSRITGFAAYATFDGPTPE